VVVRLSLDSRLGHLALRFCVLAVVVELVLGLVEERSDEVEDAVYHVRPRIHSAEASKQTSESKTYVLIIAVTKVPHGRLQFALRGTA
jgi:hypothetical protein